MKKSGAKHLKSDYDAGLTPFLHSEQVDMYSKNFLISFANVKNMQTYFKMFAYGMCENVHKWHN